MTDQEVMEALISGKTIQNYDNLNEIKLENGKLVTYKKTEDGFSRNETPFSYLEYYQIKKEPKTRLMASFELMEWLQKNTAHGAVACMEIGGPWYNAWLSNWCPNEKSRIGFIENGKLVNVKDCNIELEEKN